MDIKFQVKKMINSGGDVYDWLEFIIQLKRQHIDRDLLLEIHKVAMNNVPSQVNVGYKKLMIGLANLLSEVSMEEARERFVDAMLLDPVCAVVRVYHAQFEYLHQQKSKARQVLLNAKLSGCTPKSILRIANQNLRENKASLFDGVVDPWHVSSKSSNSSSGDSGQNSKKSSSSSSLLASQSSCSNNKGTPRFDLQFEGGGRLTENTVGKTRTLLPPTRAKSLSKSKSESCVSVSSGGSMLISITPQGKALPTPATTTTTTEQGNMSSADTPSIGSTSSSEEKSITGSNTTGLFRDRRGPTMSPFMQCKYSPLIKKRDLDKEFTNDDGGIFSLSTERKVFTKPQVQRSSLLHKFDSDVEASSITTDVKKDSDCKIGMKKSVSSPVLSRCSDAPSLSEVKEKVESNSTSDVLLTNVREPFKFLNLKSKENKQDEKKSVPSLTNNTGKMVNDGPALGVEPKNNTVSTSDQKKFNTVIFNHTKHTKTTKYNNGVERKIVSNSHPKYTAASANALLQVTNFGSAEKVDNKETMGSNINNSKEQSHSFQQPPKTTGHPLLHGTTHVKVDPTPNVQKESIQRILQPIVMNTFQPSKPPGMDTKPFANHEPLPVKPQEFTPCEEEKENQGVALVCENKAPAVADIIAPPSTDIIVPPPPAAPTWEYVPTESNKRTMYLVKGMCYYQKNVLGRGGSSKVYNVVSQDGKDYALKKVKMNDVDNAKEMHDSYRNEIKWLEKLRGNNYIIRLYNWEIVNNSILMVLEKGEHDLSHILKSKSITKEQVKDFWRQIINAVNEIHKVGIVHTDLKPANFLLVGEMLKLIDFGIANCIQDNKTSVTRNCQMGTLNYMSPEALTQDHCRISRASDVWSLGCILYYMVYKKTPYSDIKNQYSRFVAVQQGKPINYSGLTDLMLVDCLQGCLKHDRKERYTIQQLLDHPYLN